MRIMASKARVRSNRQERKASGGAWHNVVMAAWRRQSACMRAVAIIAHDNQWRAQRKEKLEAGKAAALCGISASKRQNNGGVMKARRNGVAAAAREASAKMAGEESYEIGGARRAA